MDDLSDWGDTCERCSGELCCDSKRTDDRDCGLFRCRPRLLQRFACIQYFVFACCMLVTVQQALSSGYFNSVITTIEKRFDVPSKLSGTIASTFEIGNLCTIIFVSNTFFQFLG